jgi:hypothetical protein
MRLRVDTMDDDVQGAKLRHDLLEMEHLVKEGVAYARTLHGTDEAARRIDLTRCSTASCATTRMRAGCRAARRAARARHAAEGAAPDSRQSGRQR